MFFIFEIWNWVWHKKEFPGGKKCKDYMQCYILDIFELKFCFVYIWVMKRVWHNDLEKLEPYCQGWKLVQWSNYGLQVLPR